MRIFTLGLSLFVLGGACNALLFNAAGVVLCMVCLLLAWPLHDIAYLPIQLQTIETVSAIEKRNQFAYLFNQEFGFYLGRFTGCGLFILLAKGVSDTFAFRYALLIVALVQMLSVVAARRVQRGLRSSVNDFPGGRRGLLTATDNCQPINF